MEQGDGYKDDDMVDDADLLIATSYDAGYEAALDDVDEYINEAMGTSPDLLALQELICNWREEL